MYAGYISLVCKKILKNSVVDTEALTCTENTCISFLQLNTIWRRVTSLMCQKLRTYCKYLVLMITIKDQKKQPEAVILLVTLLTTSTG